MLNTPLHEWNLKPTEAIALQKELAKHVIREDQLGEVRTIAGVDMAINEQNGMARAAWASPHTLGYGSTSPPSDVPNRSWLAPTRRWAMKSAPGFP